MKKKYLIILVMFFLTIGVTAQIINLMTDNIDFDKSIEDALIEDGLTNLWGSDFDCKEDSCFFVLYNNDTNGKIRTISLHSLPRYKCTEFYKTKCWNWEENSDEELNLMKIGEIKESLKSHIRDLIEEENKVEDKIIPNKGRITINEGR